MFSVSLYLCSAIHCGRELMLRETFCERENNKRKKNIKQQRKPRKIEFHVKIYFYRSGSKTKDQKSADLNNWQAWDVDRSLVDQGKCEDFPWIYHLAVLMSPASPILRVINLISVMAVHPFIHMTHHSSPVIQECLSMVQVRFLATNPKWKRHLTIVYFVTGGQMEHPSQMGGMVNDFGMTPDGSFLSQQNGPPLGPGNPSDRSGSPEFMTNTGNFSENSSINEGLVW